MPCDQQPSGEKEAKLTKQRRYLNCWHGFTKKASDDLPELDALPSYFPRGIGVSLYPHPHWPGFRNKLPRTGVCVILGRAALISLGNSWGLTFPTVGETPASDVKRGSGGTLQHLPQSITHATQVHVCEYHKFWVQLSHDSICTLPMETDKGEWDKQQCCHCRWSQSRSGASFPCLPPF